MTRLTILNKEKDDILAELRQERDELRKKILELELAKHELTEKMNRIEVSQKYRSDFVANMSHELRTPLNSIIVLSQLLAESRNENLSEKQIEYARTIFSSGNILLQLINEILDISKMEAGKIVLSPEEIVLDSFIDLIGRMIRPVAEKKGLNLEIRVEPGTPPSLFADPQRLLQILNNLLSNAVKFTETGSIILHIAPALTMPGIPSNGSFRDGRIAFRVTDTGIGIPEEKLGRIFEPFQQADSKTSLKYGGTGLGLTISKTLALLMKGEILVASIPGSGSSFTLIIPEKYDPSIVREMDSGRTPATELTGPLFKSVIHRPEGIYPLRECTCLDDREKIGKDDRVLLIVDDDKSFANILKEIGNDQGFKCVLALNGHCALHYAASYIPDAIILDICLPGFNGWEILDLLRKNETTRNIPIYIISGADESNEVTEKGAIGFMTKPVNMEKIGHVFRKIRESLPPGRKPVNSVFKGKTILIADDDPASLFALKSFLEEQGMEVLTASDGLSSIETLVEHPETDFILMDVMMPGMDGLTAIGRIRSIPRYNGIPIIVISAQVMQHDRDRILENGATAYLPKPLDILMLTELLHKFIKI